MAKRIQRSTPAPKRAQVAGAPGDAPVRKRRGGRVSATLVTDFTVQLATLSDAGIPVVKALTILEGQTEPGPFKDILREITEDVSGGAPLSDALGKHDKVFDTLYSSMVRAGEVGGVLDRVLDRLAEFREKAADIRSKIKQAVIYPTILIMVSVVVVSAVIIFVIPTFDEIFKSFDVDLPEPTLILLGLSGFMTSYWYLVFGVPVLAFIGHKVAAERNRGYRRGWHAVLLKVPFLGTVLNRSMTAMFARTFGTLVQAGVPHLDALGIVRDASANEVLVDAVEDIRRTVREGEGIARPMGETGLFDDVVTNMVDVGEETGELDSMLLKVADAYDEQVDRKLAALFKILEPAILVLMAVLIGGLVIALILPLTEMMSTIGAQG
ncbi:type II secretion system F family protein [Planctomycetota bacterium]|jgi:type IV pilus assembly protein PilC|nr:type II secretion system F family protein [Planctomycetota bacterium]